jgi:hypothetical protein
MPAVMLASDEVLSASWLPSSVPPIAIARLADIGVMTVRPVPDPIEPLSVIRSAASVKSAPPDCWTEDVPSIDSRLIGAGLGAGVGAGLGAGVGAGGAAAFIAKSDMAPGPVFSTLEPLPMERSPAYEPIVSELPAETVDASMVAPL